MTPIFAVRPAERGSERVDIEAGSPAARPSAPGERPRYRSSAADPDRCGRGATATAPAARPRGSSPLLPRLTRLRHRLDHVEELLASSLVGDRVIGADQFDRLRALQPLARLPLPAARRAHAAGQIEEEIVEIGTPRISAICDSREALTRLAPPSYFWTCWKVRPSAVGERFLVHPDQQASGADAGADMNIDRVGHAGPATVARRHEGLLIVSMWPSVAVDAPIIGRPPPACNHAADAPNDHDPIRRPPAPSAARRDRARRGSRARAAGARLPRASRAAPAAG